MLDKKERQEFVKDGKNIKRRKEFSFLKEEVLSGSRSLTDFIHFLANFQESFSSKMVFRKEIVTLQNKL